MLFRFTVLLLAAMAIGSAHAHNGHTISADSVQGITVDGDLSDWPADMKSHFISNPVYMNSDTPINEGFSGSYRVGYDSRENAIFVAVEVEDDEIVLDNIGNEDWNSRDGCELFFCFEHSEKKVSPVQFVYRGRPYAVFQNLVDDSLTDAVKVARASDDNRILYEWRVDVESLAGNDMVLSEGAVIGFDVAYLDRDSDNVYAFYSSSPGSRKHLESNQLADLVVGQSDSETVQLAGRAMWKSAHAGSPNVLRFNVVGNNAMFIQIPIMANGQFMASVPKGQYAITAASLGAHKVVSEPRELDVRGDTLLKEPITFDVSQQKEKQVVLFDIAHGQKALPRLQALGEEVNFTVRNSKQAISDEALEGVDLLCLIGPTTQFAKEESAAIVDFVQDGGSLLLVVDESRRTPLEETRANEMLAPFGLKITGDTEYLHNCGGIAKAGQIHKQDLEIPYSGGRAVEGGTPFAFQLNKEGEPSQPFAAYVEVSGGGRVIAMGEAMAAIFLGTPDGERLTGTPRNYLETQYWGKDSERFNADIFAWLTQDHSSSETGRFHNTTSISNRR